MRWMAVALALSSANALAAAHPFEAQQLAIRGGIQGFLSGFDSTGAAGVTVSYWGRGGLSGELTAGEGFGSAVDEGLWLTALVRYGFTFGESNANALGLGAGLSRWSASPFGPALFARSEAFYELRTREGFDLLLGFGPAMALVRTKTPPAESSFFARAPYTPGELGWSLTAGLGWAF